jgi:hypothetical protein
MPNAAEIQHYLASSGDDKFHWEWPLIEFPGGWFNWWVDESKNNLVVGQCYAPHAIGEAVKVARSLCTELKCDKIIFATHHDGEAFARLTGGRLTAYVVELEV